MKDNTSTFASTTPPATRRQESLWETLAGCILVCAGLIALCWML